MRVCQQCDTCTIIRAVTTTGSRSSLHHASQKGLSYASSWLSTLARQPTVAVECSLVRKMSLALVVVNEGTGFCRHRY